MQLMRTVVDNCVYELILPAPCVSVGEVAWGRFDELFTPAFWRGQVWQHQLCGTYADNRLGRDLREELAACLLGGYGIPAALGLAAFHRVRELGLLADSTDERSILTALEQPLVVGERTRCYRFARQKSRQLAAALSGLQAINSELRDRQLRDALTSLPGVGLKTASWIVRNLRGSDAIAILDIHIVRACRLAEIFPQNLSPERHYSELEARFLAFARAIGAPASTLDALMWDYMRRLPPGVSRGSDADDRHPHGAQVALNCKRVGGFATEQAERAET